MSVVNQMLKDLDDRNAGDPAYSAVYQPSKQSNNRVLMLVLLIVLLMILCAFGWYLYPEYTRQPVQLTTAEQNNLSSNVVDLKADDLVSVNAKPRVEADLAYRNPRPMVSKSPAQSTKNASFKPEQPAAQSSDVVVVQQNLNLNRRPEQSTEQSARLIVQPANEKKQSLTSKDFSKQASGLQSTNNSLREQALAALRAGQDALGIQLLSQLIQLEPNNTAAAKKLAAVLYAQNQTTRAEAVLEASIKLAPQDPSLRLMLARLLTQKNAFNEAFTIITPALPLAGKSIEFLGFRAALAEQLGNHQVAHSDYLQLSSEQPNESRWWLGLGISSERIEAVRMATEAYQRVITLDQLGTEIQSFAQQRINQLARIQ
jgi:MSHA biogenesis protein MshN